MNAYECDRCGTLFKRDSVPEKMEREQMKDNPICPQASERAENNFCKVKGMRCDGIGRFEPDCEFTVINQNEMCLNCSLFGGFVFELTDGDFEKLKSGKVLSFLDEYSTFLIYKGD